MTSSKLPCTYDLVEQMQYVYVRVVKAKDLYLKDGTSDCDPYVEVKLGNLKGVTGHFEKKSNPEWNRVFAFYYESLQAWFVEIMVKDKSTDQGELIGRVHFDLNEVPKRVPPDSPLAPQWCRLEDKIGDKKKKGEIMVAVWKGTQADEAFLDAWHSDATGFSQSQEMLTKIRRKVYIGPNLWYVRVNVIEYQNLKLCDKARMHEVSVRVILGNFAQKTRKSQLQSVSAMWNEDFLFVTAEPFEDTLEISVEGFVEPNKAEVLGKCVLQLNTIPRRLGNDLVPARWYSLEKNAGNIHLRICVEGGYHVFDESFNYSSDFRPSAKQLWRPRIGLLELGIVSATGLSPMKTRDCLCTTDAYCVAKYGQKWVRTRTAINSVNPKWNEQFCWEVFDPCTVITIGVFDNGHFHEGGNDSKIGKVRIRLSTLETNRIHRKSYRLYNLQTSGAEKMGEIQLAVRFSSISCIKLMQKYSLPLLPKMHHVHPLSIMRLDILTCHAIQIISMRLSRAEPPLKKEVVEYILDRGLNTWSLRKCRANLFRVKNVLRSVVAIGNWFHRICEWKRPIETILVHILLLISVLHPELILTTAFLYLFIVGIWNYPWRPRHPPCVDLDLSQVHTASSDELDEEFDSFPSTKGSETVRMRYDRLRSIEGRIQVILGDFATQLERFQNLLSWRDPRATALFMMFCFFAAMVLYVIPFQLVVLFIGLYVLRHPRFRSGLPSLPFNFFKRLPSRSDSLL
ncbi:hypothetical protein NMG60_11033789 [Bertholletia excelsa]